MTCYHCQAETNGVVLCSTCQQTLSMALTNVASYFTDAGRINPGQRVKVRSAYKSTPPPATAPPRDPISDTLDEVAMIVFGWCLNLEDDRPGVLKAMPATTEIRCGWLEGYISSIVLLEWAGEILREMLECERSLRVIIDRSDTGWYAGVCGHEMGRTVVEGDVVPVVCERQLYGTQASRWVTCPECGRCWDAGERRKKMLADARDRTMPVRTIAKMVCGLTEQSSEQKLTRRIEQWVQRGRLTRAGTKVIDGKARPVYLVGDVYDLMKDLTVAPESVAC